MVTTYETSKVRAIALTQRLQNVRASETKQEAIVSLKRCAELIEASDTKNNRNTIRRAIMAYIELLQQEIYVDRVAEVVANELFETHIKLSEAESDEELQQLDNYLETLNKVAKVIHKYTKST